jgi:hypothetical protein
MGESLVFLGCALIENLILICWLCCVCRSWVDYSFEGDKRQRLVNQVLGNLVHLRHPGVVTLLENGRRELATTWEHYRFALDGSYRNAQWVVVHDFWVSIFCMHGFFLQYSSVLMCFLLHILFCSYVFGCLRRATTRCTHLRSSTTLLTRSWRTQFPMVVFRQTMHTTRKSLAWKWTRS